MNYLLRVAYVNAHLYPRNERDGDRYYAYDKGKKRDLHPSDVSTINGRPVIKCVEWVPMDGKTNG